MLSNNMELELNKQVKCRELYSGYLYLSMASYLKMKICLVLQIDESTSSGRTGTWNENL